MLVLILGIIVFLGIHSVRIVAPEWRLAKMVNGARTHGKASTR